jgi:serine/threonine-protein kinase
MMDDTVSTGLGVAGDAAGQAPLPGYELGALIGRGGMGEVVAARDPRLGRDVAIKRMKGTSPTSEAIERFLREAKIQARLDHPAIAPVHELGHDRDGLPYFTMKRLTGRTMAEAIQQRYAQPRLLRAFVDVCLAIELAHSRHIAHRDLKPANIMLGDYGEVYILDWGIARILDEAADDSEENNITVRERQKLPGAVLGTPGYMAPEQAQGEPCSPATDVYALGCILFEILVGAQLHPSGLAGISSAIDTPTTPPSSRAQNVPPELDAACVAALAADPASRPTARQLGERVQHYLDGDRDDERRRALAAKLLKQATATTSHTDQMQLAGRALALDPESKEAAAMVARLMLEPPRDTPPEVVERMAELDRDVAHAARTYARLATLAFLALAPASAWLIGLHSWCVALMSVAPLAIALVMYLAPRSRDVAMWRFALFGWLIVIVTLSVATTPLIVVPGLLLIVTLMAAATSRMKLPAPVIVTLLLCAALGPWLLTLVGWVPQSIVIVGNTLVLTAASDGLDPTFMLIGISTALAAYTVAAFVLVRSVSQDRILAQQQLEVQAWKLRQLVPTADGSASHR